MSNNIWKPFVVVVIPLFHFPFTCYCCQDSYCAAVYIALLSNVSSHQKSKIPNTDSGSPKASSVNSKATANTIYAPRRHSAPSLKPLENTRGLI
jgi:hypothetical protein